MSKSTIRRNQSKRVLRAAVLSTPAVAAVLSMSSAASAANLYWDINGATGGASGGTTANGTWDGAATNWSTAVNGDVATQAWVGAGDTAVFSAGTNATGNSTVTVSGTQTTDGIIYEEGQVTLTGGTISLNTNGIVFNRNAAQTQTINSVISGTNGMSLSRGTNTSGVVTLTLGGNNTYSGDTTIPSNAGSVGIRLTHNNALGATGSGNGTVFGTSAGADLGFVEMTGNRLINENITLRGGGQAATSIGQLRTSGGVNTWAGTITINGTTNNLGAGLASIGGNSGTLVVTGAISAVNTGANTPGVGFVKTGSGTLVLRNSFTSDGFVRQFGGTLIIEANGALGSAATRGSNDGLTLQLATSSAGTTLAFGGNVNYTTDEGITTAAPAANLGFGFGGRAQIDNVSGDNTFAGFLRLGGSSVAGVIRGTIGADTGTSLELSGDIFTSNTSAGTASSTPSAREIHKLGGGNLIISGDNNTTDGPVSGDADLNRMHGTFVIDAGTLTLRNNTSGGTGSLQGNSVGPVNFQVNLGATLALDNTLGVNTARIGPTAAITLSAGEVKLIGNADTSVTQAAGGLSVASYSTITVDQPASTTGATTTFNLGTLTRSNRGTALLRGINNTSGFAAISGTLKGGSGTAGTSTISILTEVVGDTSAGGDGTDFVTIDGGFARTLNDSNNEYLTLASGNAALNNTKVTANTSITADTLVNSIKLTGGVSPTTVTIDSGKKLLVRSGGILGVGASGTSSAINGGTVTFEESHIETNPDDGSTSIVTDFAEEGIITVPAGAQLTISSDIAGAEGITKSGLGTLTLTGTGSTYGQAVTGLTTINAGVLEFNVDANLGASTTPININGGTLRPLSASISSRNVQLSSPGTNTIETGASANFQINGVVSGLALTKTGPGTLTLTNTSNSFNGLVIVDGEMPIDEVNANQPAFGSGTVTLAGGQLTTTGSATFDKSLVSTSSNTTGGFVIPGGAVLQYGSGSTSTVGMSGNGNYAINGGGELRLSNNTGANMVYTGRLIVNDASTLTFHSSGTNQIPGLGGTPVSSAEWVVLNDGSRLRFEVTSNAGAGFSSGTRGITINNSGIIDITGTNIVINTAGLFGATPGTITKDGSGLYSLRVVNSFAPKWIVEEGTLEFGAPGNNALSLGTGSGADWITINDGATLQSTTTNGTGSTAANQGITLAGGTGTIGAKNGAEITFNGVITGSANLKIGGEGFPIAGVTTSQDLGGTVVLGAANTYTGDTLIQGRHTTAASTTVRAAATNVLPTATNVTMDSGTGENLTFDAGGFNQTVASTALVGDGTKRIIDSTTNGGSYSTGGGIAGAGTLIVGNGSPVTATADHYRVPTMTVGVGGLARARTQANPFNASAAAGVSNVPTFTAASGRFDVTNNKLVTASDIGSWNGTNYTGVTGYIQTGRNFDSDSDLSNFNPGDPHWDGPSGIITSQSDATLSSLHSIGVAKGSDVLKSPANPLNPLGATESTTWAGQTVTGDSTLVMYSWGGDVGMDGDLDGDDYFVLDSNIGQSGTVFGFAKGDVDYDGDIDGDDYFMLDSNISTAQSSGNVFYTAGGVGGGDGGAGIAGMAAVPEPASLGVLALGAVGLLRRRSRRKN